MINIKIEFEEKVRHINLYYDMLNDILNHQAVLNITGGEIKALPSDLIKVLKANVFLLLYNLLESTIRKTIELIHITINKDAVKYSSVKEEIKKIWIEYKYNNFKNCSSHQIFDTFENIINDIIDVDYEKYINKRKSNDMSGNVDARSVKLLAKKYSFDINKRVEGNRLIVIKNRRNNLAHGNITFPECGKDYIYSDLVVYKKETILFLKEFLNIVEKYISSKGYKK